MLSLSGDLAGFGLSTLDQPCPLSQLASLFGAAGQSAAAVLLKGGSAGERLDFRLKQAGHRTGLWQGGWLADGRSAAGVIVPWSAESASARDALTGLLTRSGFLTSLAARLAEGRATRIAIGDLVRLRRLNEALGFSGADSVLASVGERIAQAFASDCIAARVGHDCFAVVTDHGPQSTMEQLRLAVEAPLRVGEMEIHPTLVLAEVNAGPESDADELLRQAEALVGAHKAQDRAKHSIQPALVGDSLSHLTLESDLRGAVERGEIEAFFQPIARLDNGQLAGFEALVRWRHPRRGLLPPDDFLPLVGEVGLMQELGLYMVQSAAREVSSWRRLNPYCKDLFVSVNLTTGDLERNSLVKEVGDIIAAAGLPDGALKLEITEGEVMRDADQAASLLTELKTVGARISLDDFGMGFSSLSWLARLPIQCLKIDRYFVRTMASSEGSEKIVRSIINLARDFDLEVVAEGVESQTIADTLAAIGCEFGQGFAYAPPMSSEEVLVYLIECSLDGSAFRIPRG